MNNDLTVGIVGAGTMGTAIAELAATGGCNVCLFDMREGAAEKAKEGIARRLSKRVADGRLLAADCNDLLARLRTVSELQMLQPCGLAIEAIAESLPAKRDLFAKLEALVAPSAILASNTSSLSISAIARDLTYRNRIAGMHFFNPVHSMKLVEIVAGIDTDSSVVERLVELARAWGKTPVIAKSTPGFIVNRIARPFYAEALLLIQEGSACAEQIDAVMRGAGFRMGPCELMDLIGHDINLAVTESMYGSYYYDKRFTPSIVQRELVDAGRLGRKVNRGFYDYTGTQTISQTTSSTQSGAGAQPVDSVIVRGTGVHADELARRLESAQVRVSRRPDDAAGVDFFIGDEPMISMNETDGRTAAQLAAAHPRNVIGVFDLPLLGGNNPALAAAYSHGVSTATRDCIRLLFAAGNVTIVEVEDSPALVVARTICMLINEACDAVQQRVCSPDAANIAMRLGVNYPVGPFEWLDAIGTEMVVGVLRHLGGYYGSERYRISPWLQQRRWRE